MLPSRRKAIAYLAVGAGAAAAGAVLGPLWLQKQTGAATLLATVFPDLHGQARRLIEWKGKVAVVNFWATWCEPCREEIPLLIDVSRKYAGAGVEVVGIAIDTVAKIRDFAAKYHITYQTLVGDARALDLLRALGNTAGALPYSVILDRSGAVSSRRLGAYKPGELEGLLAEILR
jgi:thiol-disulfide isomerase/thioredoxin